MKRTVTLLVIVALISGFAGCNKNDESEVYAIVGKEFGAGQYEIAFREGDMLFEYVDAALRALVTNGSVAEISSRYFGQNLFLFRGDTGAITALGEIPKRTLVMGLDPGAIPMSYKNSDGEYSGFDVELAKLVCQFLGWEIIFREIDPSEAEVELKSGNIDCAWGAMSFNGTSGLGITEGYMKRSKVLVVLKDSGINSMKKLEGKTLAMTGSPTGLAAFNSNEDLVKYIAKTKTVPGNENCFNTLLYGTSDVILVDKIAADYLMK